MSSSPSKAELVLAEWLESGLDAVQAAIAVADPQEREELQVMLDELTEEVDRMNFELFGERVES